MKITVNKDSIKQLGHKAGNAAFDAAETAEAAAEKLRTKAGDHIQKVRLTRAIRDLEEEIDLQMCAIGQLIYATHRGDPSDSDDMQEILQYVDGLYEELEGHEQQLRVLSGALLCGACGAENEEGSVYCRNCGQPLSRG